MSRGKKIVSLILAFSFVMGIAFSFANTVYGATSLPSDIYLKQEQKRTCTLSSAAMMLRSKMYLSGCDNWESITESSIRPSAWVEGAGMLWDWSHAQENCSFVIGHQELRGVSVSGLKAVLDAHPEGVVIHCRCVPHAVFLTDYEGDQFYCADPASIIYSGRRLLLSESYLARKLGSQADILRNVTSYWYISSFQCSEEPKAVLPFTDVSDADWYKQYVAYVYDKGIMNGLKEDIFGPLEDLTRAEVAVMLYRLGGQPQMEYKETFSDVEDGMWYSDAILWAYQNSIINGYDADHFGPSDDITREQTAVMLHRYAKYAGYDVSAGASLEAFADKADVDGFAQEAVSWAVGSGIINGKDDGAKLAPDDNTLRAECAAILMRFMEKY